MSNLKKEVTMKKLLFLAASALIAGVGFCSSVGEKVVAKVTKSDTVIEQQNEKQLILETNYADCDLLADHYSHSSHRSHSSHSSHRSHYSSR